MHNLTGSGLDETGVQREFPQARGYTIPYRCLVPKCVEHLLLAGRNISGTHLAHSNYRVMPICANMGQAAGIAAALCVQQGCSPRALDPADLQAVLWEQGVEPWIRRGDLGGGAGEGAHPHKIATLSKPNGGTAAVVR